MSDAAAVCPFSQEYLHRCGLTMCPTDRGGCGQPIVRHESQGTKNHKEERASALASQNINVAVQQSPADLKCKCTPQVINEIGRVEPNATKSQILLVGTSGGGNLEAANNAKTATRKRGRES